MSSSSLVLISYSIIVNIQIQSSCWHFLNFDLFAFSNYFVAIIIDSICCRIPYGKIIEISLFFADNEILHGLNFRYRRKFFATDVLSFSFSERRRDNFDTSYYFLGDVVFGFEEILKQSVYSCRSFGMCFFSTFIHGVLHLLGYDHFYDFDFFVMKKIEFQLFYIFNLLGQ